MAKDDKTFENLPRSAVEYINLVIKNMRYRKKARDEVREELIDHFELYLKNCATNEEKEQKAQQLISEFGNPKLLAALMRRAKKRCRPLWRTVVARAFQALAAMIILLVLYIAWFFSGKPAITTNYIAQLNNLVRPSTDESLNAAPLYNKAIETFVDINDANGLLNIDFYDANDEQKNLIRQWLAKNKEPLALVAKGAKLPYCWQHYESNDPEQSVMSVCLPHFEPLRQITHALRWRAWLNAQSNDFNSAFQDIDTCYRFGRHYKGEKTFLVEQLIGIAIESRALQTVRQMLDAYKIESIALADFQQRLQTLIDGDNFKINMRSEQLLMLDEIQRSFTDSRFGPSHIYPKRVFGTWMKDAFAPISNNPGLTLKLLFMNPNKAETITAGNALYKFVEENITKTPVRLHAEGINLYDEIYHFTKDANNLFLQMISPAIGRCNYISWRNKINAESTTLVIALVRYKQDIGAFPESLDKLVEQGYIKQVPVDPFSDKPITYRKTDNNFLLYSWGVNLEDDGGQIARDEKGKPKWFPDENDWVFWPVK